MENKFLILIQRWFNMDPHSHDKHNHPIEGPNQVDAAELRDYIAHNIKHLEEHIKIFMKLQDKLEDSHAFESLQHAIDLLQQAMLELNTILNHLDE